MILVTYGTRPEWLKIKPLLNEMVNRGLPFKTLFTGQHKDIAPDNSDYIFNMDYIINNNRLDTVIGNILTQSDIFDDDEITHVLVQGDTTSVLGVALSAFNHKKKIIHLEAGLRTYNMEHPYPEEANRQLVSRITDIHLCPTDTAKKNLQSEKVGGSIHVVGNTVLDNLVEYKSKIQYLDEVLVTLHRRENHYWLDQWFSEINNLAITHPNIKFTIPLHPNPNVQKHKHILTNVTVLNPLEHGELLNQLVRAKLVITDSGGIQEECSFFNKKCLTCRKYTERPEAVGLTTFMVDNPKSLSKVFDNHINDYQVNLISPFGDGLASKKIVDIFQGGL